MGDPPRATGDQVFRHLKRVGVIIRDKRRQQRRAGIDLVQQHQRNAGAVLKRGHIHLGGDGGGEDNPHAVAFFQLTDDVKRQLHVIAIVINRQQHLAAPGGIPRLADGIDKRIEALQGADQQGDLFLITRRMNGGKTVIAQLGGDINHPFTGVVAELDVAGLIKHQRHRRLRDAGGARNIVHGDLVLPLHSFPPFRDNASYLNCALSRRRSRFLCSEASGL